MVLPPMPGPGRPPKIREAPDVDLVLQAVISHPEGLEAMSEAAHLQLTRGFGKGMSRLAEALDAGPHDLRIAGARARREYEGPQVKLHRCEWLEATHEALGGTDEAGNMALRAASDEWNRDLPA